MENGLENKLLKTYINSSPISLCNGIASFFGVSIYISIRPVLCIGDTWGIDKTLKQWREHTS